MFTCNRVLIFVGALIAYSSCATAYFFNWGSSETTQQHQLQNYPVATFYHQRLLQAPPQASYVSGNGDPQIPVQIPAIPIQVPLQAQLSPNTNIHNVQLVPCLCPVSSDFEYDRPQEGSSSNVYVNQIKNPQK